ncbi:hypothetical protein SAMN05216358_0110 [Rhizobium sp. AN5]|uniref:hypothetical protein n=1 Tax=Rhizobium sp. AN5 TaxID=1855304 RepID=UPI000BDA1B52|nr:hypothetical protein [Rhizobium sp. AN5]SOC90086.1 hypothetical protein SAMN05216358_0110 [Rhizobium sp. AN5]
MTYENQAADTAVATVVKIDPTLNSIKQEREEAAAEAARIEAERVEAERVAEKRHLIGEVLNMQADIDKRYKAVKAQKKLLKGLREDLAAIADDEDLDHDDLKALLKRGHEAYNVGGENAFAAAAGIASVLAAAIAGRGGRFHQGGIVPRGREVRFGL